MKVNDFYYDRVYGKNSVMRSPQPFSVIKGCIFRWVWCWSFDNQDRKACLMQLTNQVHQTCHPFHKATTPEALLHSWRQRAEILIAHASQADQFSLIMSSFLELQSASRMRRAASAV
jgi:hypothetical protein